jgi:hypothetical protein
MKYWNNGILNKKRQVTQKKRVFDLNFSFLV